MEHNYFIGLLTFYTLLVLASFVVPVGTKKKESEKSKFYFLYKLSKPVAVATLVLFVGVLLAGFVGLVGMFFLWSPAPYIFFSAIVVRVIANYAILQESRKTGVDAVLSISALITELVLAMLVFVGPAKKLFA